MCTSISLSRIQGINDQMREKLIKHDFHTPHALLCKTNFELYNQLETFPEYVQTMHQTVSWLCVPPRETVSSMLHKESQLKLKTTVSLLDQALGGGISLRNITEIVGPAGVGKTQLCHMLALSATMPCSQGGLGAATLYLDTEGTFSAKRLVEIAKSRFPELYGIVDDGDSVDVRESTGFSNLLSVLDNIHIIPLASSLDLCSAIAELPCLIIEKKAKLVIIDSIAAVMRRDFDTTDEDHRYQFLNKEASLLKEVADSLGVAVVLVNQVTTAQKAASNIPLTRNFVRGSQTDWQDDSSQTVVAALGTVWSHCVNVRIVFEYDQRQSIRRKATVAKSPSNQVTSVIYTISGKGIDSVVDHSIAESGNFWHRKLEPRYSTAPGLTVETQHTVAIEQQQKGAKLASMSID